MKRKIFLAIMCILLVALCILSLSCEEEEVPTSESSTKEVIITFKQDGCDDIVKSIASGEALGDIPTPKAKKGYDIKWDVVDFSSITEDITVTAVATPIKYTITYQLDGGTNNSDNISEYTIETEFVFKIPTRDDFTFEGWYLDDKHSESIEKIAKGTTGNITVYAMWAQLENSATISFNSDGGTPIEPVTIEKGSNFDFRNVATPIKKGYKFLGWFRGEAPIILATNVERDMTVIAKWSKEQYKITYIDELNVENPNSKEYDVDSDFELKNLSKVGYAFEGWYNGTTKVTKIEKGSTGDLTLTARWKEKDLVSSKTSVLEKWSGQTLNVLVSKYGATPTAPWGQVELNPSSFGAAVEMAFDERQAMILDTYGVTVNWIQASGTWLASDLESAEKSDSISYELALPRLKDTVNVVSHIYSMSNSEYLDMRNSYYSQSAYEAFTLEGYTLFMAGGHDFIDEQASNIIVYNKELLEAIAPDFDMYNEIKNGDWTYDAMSSLATLATKDLDSNSLYDDTDRYGFSTGSDYKSYYSSFGMLELEMNESTGLYETAFNRNKELANAITTAVLSMKNSIWTKTNWTSGVSGMYDAFNSERLLFVETSLGEAIENIQTSFAYGIIPFPKLNSSQQDYITTMKSSSLPTLICVPQATKDREMSNYFVDVLSWTGEELMLEAYKDKIEANMSIDTAEDDMEIVTDYIFDKHAYEPSTTAGYGVGFFGEVKDRLLTGSSYDSIISSEMLDIKTQFASWRDLWRLFAK